MKIPCQIIKDLLPLYHDDVCSKETRALVEEHIGECAACKEELNRISREFDYPQIKPDEAKPIKTIAAAWKKDKLKAFIKGTAIALAICAFLFGGFLCLTQWKIIPVSSKLLEVSDVCRLSDGRIVYHLNVNDDQDLHFVKFTTNKDGSYYQTPYRSVIEGNRTMESGLYNNYYIIDVAENNAYQQAYGDGIVITSCYVGPKDDGILIWEKGKELPAASKELEKMFIQNK
ncbi:MAG: zf-HC2 domain-containing protein [Lachnospiraceae bacterium]|nr:zf-HC2 domain-containing protein [Lachnospiraceae bacterium]